MFQKILIANRGEIACRIIKTARRMGIATVAIYSDDDRHAMHVELADTAVALHSVASGTAYLSIDEIVDVARTAAVQAVHPGYGFLSENAEFAQRLKDSGLVFIGPSANVIRAMGDKVSARKFVQELAVPTIPGSAECLVSAEVAIEIAQEIGFPVMIKARAGGGGRGLRVARSVDDISVGFDACRDEARLSFGDEGLFIERFLDSPRHIEVQVLADNYGRTIHLGERECSIQRRYQKIIEETPSPSITERTRRKITALSVRLAKAIGYNSAGTVEFLVDRDENIYFMEMNTRLQVEHGITECTTGLDLVEWMIRIAAGEALPFEQKNIQHTGWAIECRINAEDPTRDFLPSVGRLETFAIPDETIFAGLPLNHAGGVRIDTGVREGDEVSALYDSMMAKVIVHGQNRTDALVRMQAALDAFVVRGVSTNILFHAAAIGHPKFKEGVFDTGFVASLSKSDPSHEVRRAGQISFLVALGAVAERRAQSRVGLGGLASDWQKRRQEMSLAVVGRSADGRYHYFPVTVGCPRKQGPVAVTVGQREYLISFDWDVRTLRAVGVCNGRPFTARLERRGIWLFLTHAGTAIHTQLLGDSAALLYRLMPTTVANGGDKSLLSPMPGLLVSMRAYNGQPVRTGECLAIVEAMKMENALLAPRDGTISKVLVAEGDSVAAEQPILYFE